MSQKEIILDEKPHVIEVSEKILQILKFLQNSRENRKKEKSKERIWNIR
jgi:hypothetical protein